MDIEYSSGTIVSFPFEQHKIDALFCHHVIHREHVEQMPVILRLHGILGNLLDETEHLLPGLLAAAGYSSLTMNTLLANLGLFFGFGVFDDAIQQIDAGCRFLRQIGFQKIVVAGHGLGSCMAIRYGALANDPAKHADIVGIIAVATPYAMPQTIRRRWERFGSEPSYDDVHQRTQRLCEVSPENRLTGDEIVVVKRAHGYTTRPEHTDIYTLETVSGQFSRTRFSRSRLIAHGRFTTNDDVTLALARQTKAAIAAYLNTCPRRCKSSPVYSSKTELAAGPLQF